MEKEEEFQLLRAFLKDKNNIELQQRVLGQYRNLIWKCIISCHQDPSMEEDLFQEGCVALFEAIKHFDFNYGTAFSSFAVPYITGYMKRYLSTTVTSLSSDVKTINKAFGYKKMKLLLEERYGRILTAEELSSLLKIPTEKIKNYERLIAKPIFLDQELTEESDETIGSMVESSEVSPEEYAEQTNLKEIMMKYISQLSPREQLVLRLRFNLDDGQTRKYKNVEIGEILNLSRETIRKTEKRALSKLARMILENEKNLAFEVQPYSIASYEQESIEKEREKRQEKAMLKMKKRPIIKRK